MHHSEALYRGVYAKRRLAVCWLIGVVVLAREKGDRVGNYLRKIRGSFYGHFLFLKEERVLNALLATLRHFPDQLFLEFFMLSLPLVMNVVHVTCCR